MLSEDEYKKNQIEHKTVLKCTERLIATGARCAICGYQTDWKNIQNHHIAGQKHGDATIPVCLNCHATLTRRQMHGPKMWMKPDLPPELKPMMMVRGVSDILFIMSRSLRDQSDEIIQLFDEMEMG